MSDVAIKVEGLGKRFTIGKRESYKTIRETVTSALAAPFRILRRQKDDPETILWALKDVNFEVQQGEAVGIIGRNGAGKSTLLKVLSRITDPTEGQITINGRIGSLLEVGTGFHPELSGRENIFMNGAILGMRRAEIVRKFDEIVAFAEVDRFIDTPVKRYSSGMYTRLAFAVAAHLEPEILIVDEVLAVGDAQFQKKCLGKMGEVAHEGRTVLFVSHNMSAVQVLCRGGIVLNKGTLVFSGPILEAVHRHIEGSATASSTILANARRHSEDIEVSSVTVNECVQDSLDLLSGVSLLTIRVSGSAKRSLPIDLEGVMVNWAGDRIGHFCPTRQTGKQLVSGTGEFWIETKVVVPRLNSGHYSLRFWLSEPNRMVYYDFVSGVHVYAHGSPLHSGEVLQSTEAGPLLIESHSALGNSMSQLH